MTTVARLTAVRTNLWNPIPKQPGKHATFSHAGSRPQGSLRSHPILRNLSRIGIPGCVALFFTLTALAAAEPLQPRPPVIKPTRTIVNASIQQTDRIAIKFRDGLTVRLRNGTLTDLGSDSLNSAVGLLGTVENGTWERTYALPEAQLDHLRLTAETNLGRAVADLNLQFTLILPEGADAGKAIDSFNALDCVEIALPVPLPVEPPTPNYQSNQGYLNAATAGVNAICMWQLPGGTGGNSAVADIEYSWNLSHQDLTTATLLGPTPVDPFSNDDHGTAVLGEIGALRNGWGVTGIAYGSTLYVVGANTSSGYNVGAAITTALGTLSAGDVILIEQQIAGPNYTGNPPGTQFGLVPVEWYQPYYNAIVTAVGNGVVVVEAAGNGSQNLDSSVYSTGNGGHWPFLSTNDSGAIIVGAGASPGGSDTDRSRLSFSNYGSTLDLQGWGENVYSTGYGTLYSAEGKNRWFTATFSGTSSASPIVAGACLLLQSTYQAATGSFLTPAQVRSNLRTTGSAQQAGTYPTSQNIGPRPNASAALCNAVPAIDANSNLVPDLCEALAGIQACCFSSGGCTDTTPANCAAYGGTAKGAGTACATTTCQATQACCFPGGGCADLTPANCTAAGGTPYGSGTACATTMCPATQACCFLVGSCTDMIPMNCTAAGGTPQGSGTTCATIVCPVTEACCLTGGGCSDMTPANCAAAGGSSQGPGTACATTICQMPEACCLPGPVPTCANLLPATCQMQGGLPQGAGTSCLTTQCQMMVPKFTQPFSPAGENIASNIDLLTMLPNVVVADDFQSDGRPITVVRWWGSYTDPRYAPVAYGGASSPYAIDGWLISFHEPLAATQPPRPALGLYFAPAANVSVMPLGIVGCDGLPIFEYVVEIVRCCLMSAMSDSRSGLVPAVPNAFNEQYCYWYDIDIQAVTGMTYQRNPQNGMCVQMASQNTATNNFWGWHTAIVENGRRQALWSTTMPGPVGGPWMYGPWSNVLPICSPPPINMAFELLTNNPVVPPPCCWCPGDMDGSNYRDGLDIQGFIGCIFGAAPPGFNCTCADMNGDGRYDSADVPLFINRLMNKPTCP